MSEKLPALNQAKSLKDFLEKDQIRATLSSALPAWLSVDRLLRIVFSQAMKTPKIMSCTKESILQSVMQCAQLGIEPILGRGYLVPYSNSKKVGGQWQKVLECQFQVGYQGLVDLARRSGKILDVYSMVVYENDQFDIQYGTELDLVHKPYIKGDPGPIIGAYAVWTLTGGTKSFEFMPIADIHKRREASQSYKYAEKNGKRDSVWHKWPEEMCRKTVIKHSAKLMPASIEFMDAVSMDDTPQAVMVDGDRLQLAGVDFEDATEEATTDWSTEFNHNFLDLIGTNMDAFLSDIAKYQNTDINDVMGKAVADPDRFKAAFCKKYPDAPPPVENRQPEPPAGFECQEPGCTFIAKTERGLKSHMTRSHKPVPKADTGGTLQEDPPGIGDYPVAPGGTSSGPDMPQQETPPIGDLSQPIDPQTEVPEMFQCIRADIRDLPEVQKLMAWVADDDFLSDVWAKDVAPNPINDIDRAKAAAAYLERRLESRGNTLGTAATGIPER